MRSTEATAFFRTARDKMKPTSTWFALQNPVFCRLWLASLLSGIVVLCQDLAATWLMHDLGASSLSLSLMAILPLHAASRGFR
jgi:Transmembrane secretion effector